MADETKKVFVTKENLQKVLEYLRDKNAELYLGKEAQAKEAARVANALKLTVGDQEVSFDGSAEKTAAVAAKQHIHETTDITGFDAKVQQLIADAESTHTHANKAELDKISDGKVAEWDAKIGVEDVAELKYANDGVGGQTNVKAALDILIKNVQIGNAALADTTANVNGLADRLTTAEGDIDALEAAVGDANSGLTKKVADLEKANAEGGAVANAIKDAKQAGLDAQTAVQAEVTRAQGVEQGLRADLGQKADEATADTAFGRIAKVKADLTAEATAARAAEKEAKDAADAAQADVDALEAKVGEVPADKTVVQMIADAKTEATYDDTDLKNRVATIEGDYLKAADKTELQGKIDDAKAVADDAKGKIDAFLDANAVKDDTINTLKEIQLYIQEHGTEAAGMVQNIAANKAAIEAEVVRAKAAEKANADDIAILKGADTVEGSVAKAVKDAKDALQANIDEKVAQADYDVKIAALEKADADNLAAAKKYADDEDAKIEAILGHKAIEGGEAATGLCADVAANAAAIAAEATARQQADAGLADRLTALESGDNSVAAQVKVVKDALDAHKEAQATKDQAQDQAIEAAKGRLDVLQGGADVDGSVAKAVADAEGRVKVTTDALDNRVTTLENAVGDSEKGLVKDVNELKTIEAGTRLSALETKLANLVPLEDAELQTMLDSVYTK